VQADLDHAATTPPRPEVLEVLERWVGAANASARHLAGQAARRAVEHAREQAAAALGCSPHDVVFTSGGTEADNLAVKGIAWAAGRRPAGAPRTSSRPRSSTPPSSSRRAGSRPRRHRARRRRAASRRRVAPTTCSRASGTDRTAARPTALVSVMGANNELGAVNDIAALGAALRARGVPLHVDAVQCVATLDVSLERWSADALAVSAHKVGGPQGVGVAVLRRGLAVEPTSHGGGQDRGLRSGTFAVGLIAACG
jgi:cysteine desulfurase